MEQIYYILIDVLQFGLPYCLLALGIFISYRQLDFADLGAEGTFTLGGAVVAVCLTKALDPFVSTIIATLAGFTAGIITGLLHTKCKIPGLLSGIITMTSLFSINMFIMGFGSENNTSGYSSNVYLNGNNIDGEPIKTIFDTFLSVFDTRFYNIILIELIVVIVVVILSYFFFGTEIGMSIRSTGMNPKMSRAQGINTNLMIILGLGLSNALISMGGALFSQVNGSASTNMGVGVLVIGLSSIIIGEAVFGKRTFKNWIISVTLGAIVYNTIVRIAIALGLPNYLLKLLYALLITIVLIIPLVKKSIENANKKHHAKEGI